MLDFQVKHVNIKDKKSNLNVVTSGVVKSTKFFPVFEMEGRELIFKPLSKTKPLTTPLFAYSEVYWSYIYKNYFDSKTPLYHLAFCEGLNSEQEKYYDKGTLVENNLKDNERLVNLLEYFRMFPDNINIDKYENYCMKIYDYTKILNTNFLKQNEEMGRKVAWQILLSILRLDQNFHYENINFILKDNKLIDIYAPIDFEFSSLFLYPDSLKGRKAEINKYINDLFPPSKELKLYEELILFKQCGGLTLPSNYKNIIAIVKAYPKLVEEFIKRLEILRKDIINFKISDDYNYITACNSNTYKIYHELIKNKNLENYEYFKNQILPIDIDKERMFNLIIQDTINCIDTLILILNAYLNTKEDLDTMTIEEFVENKKEFNRLLVK